MRMFDFIRRAVKTGYTLQNPAALEWAVWLHDIIYDPKSSANEADSAELAAQLLEPAGVQPETISKVCQVLGQVSQALLHCCQRTTAAGELLQAACSMHRQHMHHGRRSWSFAPAFRALLVGTGRGSRGSSKGATTTGTVQYSGTIERTVHHHRTAVSTGMYDILPMPMLWQLKLAISSMLLPCRRRCCCRCCCRCCYCCYSCWHSCSTSGATADPGHSGPPPRGGGPGLGPAG
jgi:hypothetical protein